MTITNVATTATNNATMESRKAKVMTAMNTLRSGDEPLSPTVCPGESRHAADQPQHQHRDVQRDERARERLHVVLEQFA